MKNHKQHIGNKWENKKAPLDKESLWNKISSDSAFPAEKEKTKRGGLFFLIFLSFGLALYFYNYQFSNEGFANSNDNLFSENNLNNSEKEILIDNSKSIEENLAIKDEIVSVNTESTMNRNQKNELNKNLSSINNENKSVNEPNKTVRTNSNSKKSTAIDINSSHSSRSSTRTYTSQSKSNIAEENNFQNNSLNNNSSTIQINLNSIDNSTTVIETDFKNSKIQNLGNENIQNSISTNQVSNKNDLIQKTVKSELRVRDIEALQFALQSSARKEYLPFPIIDLVVTEDFKWKINFMVGLGKDDHSIINNFKGPTEKYSLWNQYTSPDESRFYNLSLTRKLPKNYNLSIELEMHDMFQVFERYIETERKIIRNDPNEQGFYSYETEGIDYEVYHRYQLFNLNLMLEKAISLGKFNVMFGLGGSLNLKQNISGDLYDDMRIISNVSDLDSYSEKSNLIGFASLRIDYPISKSWYVFANGRYYHGRNLTTAGFEFDHSFTTTSINFGLSKAF